MLSRALSNCLLNTDRLGDPEMAPPLPQHGRGRAHRVWQLQGWACHCCSESVPAPQAGGARVVHAWECWAAAQTTPGLHSPHPSCWHELCFPVTEGSSSQPSPWPCAVYQSSSKFKSMGNPGWLPGKRKCPMPCGECIWLPYTQKIP